MNGTRRTAEFLLGLAGLSLFLLVWQLIGVYRLLGLTWPPLTSVLAILFDPARTPTFARALGATFSAAGGGFLIGASLGVAVAAAVHLQPAFRPGVDRLATVINALPGIALGPILIVTLSPAATPLALATINVFFLIYVAAIAGLSSASPAHRDLFSVLGATKLVRLWRLELPAALPTIASGARLSVAAALIGAVLGEWFGAPHGLGLIIIGAMQNFQIPLLWSAVVLIAGASIILYGMATLAERTAYRRFR